MEKSFTLIELIVVIAIIAILAAIIAPNAFKAIEKANIQKAIRDMKTIGQAAMIYYADTGKFPATDDQLGPVATGQPNPNYFGFIIDADASGNPVLGWDGPYLETWPNNPWGRVSAHAGYTIGGYYWDYKDVATEIPGLEWNVEIDFGSLNQDRKNYCAGMVDQTLDSGDGACAGIFRAYCPPGPANWASWPKYIVATGQ